MALFEAQILSSAAFLLKSIWLNESSDTQSETQKIEM